MREVEFTNHAVHRVVHRLNGVVSYADVQRAVGQAYLRLGPNMVTVKKLSAVVTVKDDTAFNGFVRGNTVVAHVDATTDGAKVVTVALH